MHKCNQVHQVYAGKRAKKDPACQRVENKSMQLWHHTSLFHQASCGREGCAGRRAGRFPRLSALTSGSGAALALRILSAVQYVRASSAGVSTECFMILSDGGDFEKRLHAARYTPTSKHRRIVPTRGRMMSFCCRDIMAISFRKDDTDRTHVQAILPIFSSLILLVVIRQLP